jgi:hypothetical protein
VNWYASRNLAHHAPEEETHMADPPPYSDTGEDTGVEPDRQSTSGLPRWVKVSGIIVGVVVLLGIVLALTGVIGGQHGPGQFGPGQHGP